MSGDIGAFQTRFGRTPPAGLRKLLADASLRALLPARAELSDTLVVEIQYFLDIDDHNNWRPEQWWVAFAVNTDGCTLLVDLQSEDEQVLQDEEGNVEAIGVALVDLLRAEWHTCTQIALR